MIMGLIRIQSVSHLASLLPTSSFIRKERRNYRLSNAIMPLSLYTGSSIAKLGGLFQPLNGFQGPLDFHDHGSWFVGKVALTLLLQTSTE